MKVYVYRTSGGKTLLSTLSKEVKPDSADCFRGNAKDGVKIFVRNHCKNITPYFMKLRRNLFVYFIIWVMTIQ